MGRHVSLFIAVLLCTSLRPLSSQEVSTDSSPPSDPPTTISASDAPHEAGVDSTDYDNQVNTTSPTDEVITNNEVPVVEVTTTLSKSSPDSTAEAILDQPQQATTSLATLAASPEVKTTSAGTLVTDGALEKVTTTTETQTTEPEVTPETTVKNMAGPTTSLTTTFRLTTSKTTCPPTTSPTTPITTKSSSTPTALKPTTVDDNIEESAHTTLPPTPTVTPLVFKTSAVSSVASSGTTSTLSPGAVGAPPAGNSGQSSMPVWLWILITALVTMLVSAVCIALLVQRRRKSRAQHGFGGASMNGLGSQRSKKKKKGEGDVWAGPVLMMAAEGNGNECEGKGGEGDGDVDVEGNGGVPVEAKEPMLSSFAPSDEEKAVGADGTKEARRWSEHSPLLYIDEDAAAEKEGEKPNKQQLEVFSEGGEGAGKTEVEMGAPGQQEKVGPSGETGETLSGGGIAFCQTTAV